MRRTACDTTANSTVSNVQQAVRGISVITPLPTGEGTGEGPAGDGGGAACCGGGASLCGCGCPLCVVVVAHSLQC